MNNQHIRIIRSGSLLHLPFEPLPKQQGAKRPVETGKQEGKLVFFHFGFEMVKIIKIKTNRRVTK